MTRYILLSLLMIQSVIACSQNYTLPSVLFDSLVFEVRKGRSCDSLNVLNERLIESQGVQLVNYDKLVKLTEGKVSALTSLIGNSEKEREIDARQYALDKSKMKQKIKRLWVWVAGEGIVILILVILL